MERQVIEMVRELKNASKNNDAPIWSKIAKNALKSNSNKKTINLKKIDALTDNGNAVIVSGKVLGTGKLSHKIIVSSFSISSSAAKKIKESGGEILKFSDMIERFPTGKDVKIIG
jgi:large subunit ribosomal protein L18e|tara:strand:- start:1245 stop:1589 length:345 start_codon:yes stop_codon:yes gene_type:complete